MIVIDGSAKLRISSSSLDPPLPVSNMPFLSQYNILVFKIIFYIT